MFGNRKTAKLYSEGAQTEGLSAEEAARKAPRDIAGPGKWAAGESTG